MATNNLWIRAGDADGYHTFDTDLHAAADYLFEMGARYPLHTAGRFGLQCAGFNNRNYISAYWGDGDAGKTPDSDLTPQEIAQINTRLQTLQKENP